MASAPALAAPASEADEKIAKGLIDIIETARQRTTEKAQRLKIAV